MRSQPEAERDAWHGPRLHEFVALMAALMASNALAIDSMLPALPAIGAALDMPDANQRQLVITAYLLGFGGAQIAYGPLADRFGRKRLLIGSLVLYMLFAVLCGIAGSFTLLLIARAMLGVAAAGTRVLVVAVIRDRYSGSAMARVMSLTMIIFMLVPMLAPSFGQAVLAIGTWRHIFIGLAVYALVLLLWAAVRLPETLPETLRRPLSAAHLGEAMRLVVTNRASAGNTLSMTLVLGGLFAFIGSIQQIVFDVFKSPEWLGLVFAMIGAPMALASFANSRMVHRLGSRRILLSATFGFSAVALVHLAVAATVGETLWLFVLLQAMTMSCFGLIGANAGSLAMEPLGHIAGTASSVQGLTTTVGGALIGYAIGQQFDGTTVPFLIGLTVCGLAGLAVALWANPRPVAG